MKEMPSAANSAQAVVSGAWNWAAPRYEVTAGANPVWESNAVFGNRTLSGNRARALLDDRRIRTARRCFAARGDDWPEWSIDEARAKANRVPKPENRLRTLDPFAVPAIYLLILTGARLREILVAKWAFVDSERGLLDLPDGKTRKKRIYLSAAALFVLSSLPRIEGNPHIVAGSKSGEPRAEV